MRIYAVDNGAHTVVQVDGDGQHPASEIPKLLVKLLESDADPEGGAGAGNLAQAVLPKRLSMVAPAAAVGALVSVPVAAGVIRAASAGSRVAWPL